MTIPFSRFSEYFMAVARTGNLRRAADLLFISVSAVHRQIALAEESLGVPLFERLPTGLKLTLAGELLYADLLKWQKDFQQTCIRFDEIQGLKRGAIDFGLIAALSDGLIIEAIDEMRQNYPWLNFNIQIDNSDVIAKKIVDADIDFGVILDPIQRTNLDVLSFVEMPLGFIMSPQHELAQEDKISLSVTYHERHIVADEPLVIHDRVSAIYKRHQLNPKQVTTCTDIRLMLSLLKKNMGISILSYLDAYSEIQRGELVFIPLREKGLQPLTVALCVAPKRQLSRASQILIQLLMRKLDQFKVV